MTGKLCPWERGDNLPDCLKTAEDRQSKSGLQVTLPAGQGTTWINSGRIYKLLFRGILSFKDSPVMRTLGSSSIAGSVQRNLSRREVDASKRSDNGIQSS